MPDTCSSCRFWRAGICRRYPPAGNRVWPHVDGADWCGEHRPGDQPAAAAVTRPPRNPRGTLVEVSRRRIVERAS
ncbi:hypothetical protein [Methylobacterium aquaticum]|uniref:Uncharacterized protein n=1 Tax=Methylobacterium aquaticum TaxID=270351 RepID=A0A0C6FGZ8_9HYPH|nr:hypothetical protein [Methylobacterium aquaticum]BAQ44344.1 hypothetical protein Maq22A_c04645 [Methylobacterium aquaticum]